MYHNRCQAEQMDNVLITYVQVHRPTGVMTILTKHTDTIPSWGYRPTSPQDWIDEWNSKHPDTWLYGLLKVERNVRGVLQDA